jgi:prepilin-type N-terminal cleavage/methylation domain-containing protein
MNKRGFTLIELLITIAIIGVLATLAMVGVRMAQDKAKIAKAQNDTTQIEKAISMLVNDTLLWPGIQEVSSSTSPGFSLCESGCSGSLFANSAGLTASDGNYSGWDGPYLRSALLDAWNHEYFFDTYYGVKNDSVETCVPFDAANCHYAAVVGSAGPDGIVKNADDIIKAIN